MYYMARLLKKLKPIAKRNTILDKQAKIEGGSQVIDSSIGKYSFCGYDCVIVNTEIGGFCSIGSNVKIGLSSHPLDWVSTSCAFYYGRDSIKKTFAKNEYKHDGARTVIGNDVWIADNVMIKSGVTIADGAVIGMGAIVTHNVGPYEIVAGNPAKLIRKRFDDETIKQLLDTKWWQLGDADLLKKSNLMNTSTEFLKSF